MWVDLFNLISGILYHIIKVHLCIIKIVLSVLLKPHHPQCITAVNPVYLHVYKAVYILSSVDRSRETIKQMILLL